MAQPTGDRGEPAAQPVLVAREVGPLPGTPCDRCGGYAVLTRRGGCMLCPACLDRSVHEIERTPVDFPHLVEGTWQLFRASWWRAWLVSLAVSVLPYLLTVALPLTFLVKFALAPVALLSLSAVVHLGLQVIDPDLPRGIGGALRQALRTWPSLLAATFFGAFGVAVGTFLLVVPGIYLILGFSVMVPLVVSGESFAEAMAKSLERVEGRRFLILGVLLLAMIPYLLVLPTLVGVALLLMVIAGASPALVVMPNAAYVVLGPLLLLPPVFLSVVLHAKLRPRAAPAPA